MLPGLTSAGALGGACARTHEVRVSRVRRRRLAILESYQIMLEEPKPVPALAALAVRPGLCGRCSSEGKPHLQSPLTRRQEEAASNVIDEAVSAGEGASRIGCYFMDGRGKR